ncbi:uncharacterized protein LOC115741613 isoform X1 [Rhodamnia argentea]|uniref:Uncharacterized protein LOC115741613 isoform X1 n=1 Tax=Rhodamnia argentea TaxID=178133 RepID=A0A8B8P9M1_9MYRT|nr:uncharacterized protein LOC115741613 isoform X1 [Rhodamnia argentea]XP_048136443.1 uncharacterized protein LOC115741613 isoform X1 [Rhodamnia argentea]XP_048136444.1 uncharacterized protein LOC115741613 isoform X1 [Rhodamnia argentea]XP_048136445.1 uncharacterized protein LOC115741613 isoform X1 [Rhodamnia argentea]XP_048136446.1 uncharacterized protein LOC115741613 isoform X1 [Rhodamnia argentea]
MALVTHQFQGSYVAFPPRPLSLSKVLTLKRCYVVGKTDRPLLLKHHILLRVVSPRLSAPRVKCLRISSFKGIAQNDESSGGASGTTSKSSVKLSYLPNESDETIVESPKAQNVPVSYTSEADESIGGSPAIQRLFRKWLTILRTRSPGQLVDEISGEALPPRGVSETGTPVKERSQLIKALWCHFWGLDAAIKIPFMIFAPLYLAINVAYGSEVSKELNPLWILGPVVVALYVKLFRGLWALYLFTFKQTIKLVKNLPVYYLTAYQYIASGKLKEDVRSRVWQPVVDVKNLDYKELSRRKLKELQEWLLERYLDFVESIWPYYCRTIRFLKRANLI